MKKYIVCIMAFFLSSCTYFLKGQLEILVTTNDAPLQEAQLALYGKNNNKEVFIGYLYPNSQGKVVTNIDFSKYQSLKIVTTNNSLQKILLPAIKYVSIPHWWQEQVLSLKINLAVSQPFLKTSKRDSFFAFTTLSKSS